MDLSLSNILFSKTFLTFRIFNEVRPLVPTPKWQRNGIEKLRRKTRMSEGP